MEVNNQFFISIEGNEGVGKTTALQFVKQFLQDQDQSFIVTREPGGTSVAEKIRAVLLEKHDEPVAKDTELLLMFASRAQHVAQVIRPALAEQQWVICDRFVDASYAYQGGGREIELDRIASLDQWVLQGFKPGLTLLLDAPVDVCLARVYGRGDLDRFESEESAFFERVRKVYLDRAAQDTHRFKLINTDCNLAKVNEQITNTLIQYFQSLI